jgi:hypothetical protein
MLCGREESLEKLGILRLRASQRLQPDSSSDAACGTDTTVRRLLGGPPLNLGP